MHRLEYEGKFLKSHGTFTVPRSPQGHPVVIQAGSSARGKMFAARWAETMFVGYPDFASARKREYAAMKAAIAALNRDPDKVTINTIAYPVVAETRAEAEDKMGADRLAVQGGRWPVVVVRSAELRLQEEGDGRGVHRRGAGGHVRHAGDARSGDGTTGRNPTVRDFLEVTRRGRPREAIIGSGKDIADRLEKWFTEGACDGYVIAGTHTPGTFEDFVRFVVPELQRRGLSPKEYKGATLRENLGLGRPEIGGWKLRTGLTVDASPR